MKQRILLTVMSLNAGGAETHAVSLACELKRQGLDVVVVSNGGTLVEELMEAGVTHYEVPLHTKTPLSILTAFRRLKEIIVRQNIGLIHAHARIPAFLSVMMGKKYHIPVVTTSHGMYKDGFPYSLITRWGDRVIAVSQDIKQQIMRSYGYAEDKITVIENGIDIVRFHPREEERPGGADILYVSRLSGDRGRMALVLLDAMPKILEKFPHAHVRVVGDGDMRLTAEAKAADLNKTYGEGTVSILGERTDVPDLLALSDAAVGVGRSALEAMAAGLPVVIAGEAGYLGLLTPENFAEGKRHNFSGRGTDRETTAENLAQDLIRVLSDEELKTVCGRMGRENIQKDFSIGSMTEKIIEVYRKAGLSLEETH